jgi:hypothetical protein
LIATIFRGGIFRLLSGDREIDEAVGNDKITDADLGERVGLNRICFKRSNSYTLSNVHRDTSRMTDQAPTLARGVSNVKPL